MCGELCRDRLEVAGWRFSAPEPHTLRTCYLRSGFPAGAAMHDVRDAAHPRKPQHSFVTARNPPLMVGTLAAVDAALFTAIGALHLGASFGSISAPRAHWAAPIELFGALCCVISAGAVWTHTRLAREIAWIVNGISIWCVMLGAVQWARPPCHRQSCVP